MTAWLLRSQAVIGMKGTAMLHKIDVANKKFGGQGEYIGRPSALGNPFTSKTHGQGQRVQSVQESIDLFEQWLEEKIQAKDKDVLAELTRLFKHAQHKPLTLVCWCAPGPCHGDVIKRVLERTARKMEGTAQ